MESYVEARVLRFLSRTMGESHWVERGRYGIVCTTVTEKGGQTHRQARGNPWELRVSVRVCDREVHVFSDSSDELDYRIDIGRKQAQVLGWVRNVSRT